MKVLPGEQVVRTGHFIYDGRVPCPVRIVQTAVRHGTGDREDPPEVAEDLPGTWVRIDLTAAGSPDRWGSSIEGFESLDAALAHFASSVTWDP